ncbi:SDR family oxidoreductase [Patescibacteria group bacterium]|nr:SDR family oxidoreductase [Patescibacteria group bacterium]MBU1886079.1 SDR family oxidoreductase [Patescibacteria group bacterium]
MKNKFAIVTGSSTGIGRAIALALAKEGVFIALAGRTQDKLLKTKTLIAQNGGQAEVFIGDFTKLDSLEALIASIKQRTDKVDILVNVAGIWHGKDEVYAEKDFESFSREVILDTYAVWLTAPTLLAHAFIPLMPKGGKIINISGTFENGAKGWLPYFVSKKAVEDLTIGLAEELKDKDIQVNAISPSDTATEAYQKYFPQYMDEAIEPDKIGEYAVYLCSEEAKEITGKVFVMKKDKEPYEGYHT